MKGERDGCYFSDVHGLGPVGHRGAVHDDKLDSPLTLGRRLGLGRAQREIVVGGEEIPHEVGTWRN